MNSTTLKQQPVVIVFSILAALEVINGGLGLIDAINRDTVGIVSLVIGALTAGASFYVRGMTAPWDTVVSKVNEQGLVVPGPAANRTQS
jgi:hypothetical protein